MAENKDKKKFFETGFGKFVKKAGSVLPEIAQAGINMASGDFKDALKDIEDIGHILRGTAPTDPEAQKLLQEFEKFKLEFERDLTQMKYDHEVKMSEIEAKNRDIDMQNTVSARELQKVYIGSGKRDWSHIIFGALFILLYLAAFYAVLFIPLPEQREFALHQIIGVVEGLIMGVGGFYFGSSSSSRKKDEVIGRMINK